MATTILRFEKIKHKANIRQAGAHQYRHHKETPNANANLSQLNTKLIGTTNLMHDVDERLNLLDKQPRKNSVLAVEGIMTLSPEIFETDENEKRVDKIKRYAIESREWLKNTFGDNAVNAVLHLDESNPHIHMTIVPMLERDGVKALCAKDMFDKFALSSYQKSFFAHMSKAFPTLESPQFGSKRKHTEIKSFYSKLDEIKSSFTESAMKIIDELKEGYKQEFESNYLMLMENSIERLAQELQTEVSEELKEKMRADFTSKMNEVVENAFSTSEADKDFAKELQSKFDELKTEMQPNSERTPVSFSPKM